ncbi:uncharacterized protein LOC106430284 isoform X1 [Brassica napus]|uniref:(rape) hypothetical protein n=1 Tax=Brassica napus TaxID=3708 RepID=A0A816KJI2_BRANA|nr:uncharacterized protein LOC106430284 isoform X1 [Brassica napus]XP_013726510.1 uncharacterized protein LOC106430284 isoform X1 [Brassica napus]XP_013726511.1 uncharacterized protein LOC106430284 isoform X1 [Brassica napus]XP_048603626.1 uncharacterized protein LOC106430284 isoform X1 [Brassica napus]XP_048603627.1 uncharacterized protein LOC106430284 isoform X1 [Brassica napus]CAF1911041.1 unnamed protein product [Brassica napus]
MVATNINPKFVGGCLFYNESLATHGLLKEFFVEVRLVPSMVILRNLSQSRSRSLIAMFLNSTPHVRPLNKRLWNSFAKVRWLILTQPMDSAASHVLCARASCFVDSHLSAAPDAVIRKQFRVQMVVEDVTNAALFVAVDEEITKLSLGRNHS